MFKVPFLPIGSPNQTKKRTKTMPTGTSKNTAILQVQRLSKETRFQLAKGVREETSPNKCYPVWWTSKHVKDKAAIRWWNRLRCCISVCLKCVEVSDAIPYEYVWQCFSYYLKPANFFWLTLKKSWVFHHNYPFTVCLCSGLSSDSPRISVSQTCCTGRIARYRGRFFFLFGQGSLWFAEMEKNTCR